MTGPSSPSSKKPQDKLAQALRENLRRRKAQARARSRSDAAAETASALDTAPVGDDASGVQARAKGTTDG